MTLAQLDLSRSLKKYRDRRLPSSRSGSRGPLMFIIGLCSLSAGPLSAAPLSPPPARLAVPATGGQGSARAAATTTAPTAEAVAMLDKIQQFYDSAQTFQARFHQRYHYRIYRRVKHSVGRVFFRKPGMMRWDYETPTQRLFISDGETLWVYEPEDAQAFRRALRDAQLPVSLRFLSGEGRLADDFHPALGEPIEGHPGLVNLELTPKAETQQDYQRLQLLAEPETGRIRVSILIDGVGNRNEIIFREVVVNQPLPDRGFRFTPPEGVEIIENRR